MKDQWGWCDFVQLPLALLLQWLLSDGTTFTIIRSWSSSCIDICKWCLPSLSSLNVNSPLSCSCADNHSANRASLLRKFCSNMGRASRPVRVLKKETVGEKRYPWSSWLDPDHETGPGILTGQNWQFLNVFTFYFIKMVSWHWYRVTPPPLNNSIAASLFPCFGNSGHLDLVGIHCAVVCQTIQDGGARNDDVRIYKSSQCWNPQNNTAHLGSGNPMAKTRPAKNAPPR